MGLRRVYEKQYQGVFMQSGHFYKFKYRPFEHDPYPLVLFLHFIVGEHENTNHQWRLFQAINFAYVPRAKRKVFITQWLKLTEKGGKVKLNWQKIVAKFPYIKSGIRRYQFKPTSYITKLEEVEREKIEKEVVKSLFKDYSKRISVSLRGLFARKRKEKERNRKKVARDKKKKIIEAERKKKQKERQKKHKERQRRDAK